MTAQEILKLIEEVDPADSAKMDEIDARVWCFIKSEKLVSFRRYIDANFPDLVPLDLFVNGTVCPLYTRSRNSLKEIRPKGLTMFYVGTISSAGHWIASMENINKGFDIRPRSLPTEELAELHAIIQSIEYERSHG